MFYSTKKGEEHIPALMQVPCLSPNKIALQQFILAGFWTEPRWRKALDTFFPADNLTWFVQTMKGFNPTYGRAGESFELSYQMSNHPLAYLHQNLVRLLDHH